MRLPQNLSRQQLLDRIEELEVILGADRESWLCIRERFLLGPIPCKIVGILLAREQVSRESIFTILYGLQNDQPSTKLIDQNIFRIRRAGIRVQMIWGTGYALSKEEKERVGKILESSAPINRAELKDRDGISHNPLHHPSGAREED